MKKLLILGLALSPLTAADVSLLPPEMVHEAIGILIEQETGLYVRPGQININNPQKLASICSKLDPASGNISFLLRRAALDENGIALKSDGTPIAREDIQETLAAMHDKKAQACDLIRAFFEKQQQLLSQDTK